MSTFTPGHWSIAELTEKYGLRANDGSTAIMAEVGGECTLIRLTKRGKVVADYV